MKEKLEEKILDCSFCGSSEGEVDFLVTVRERRVN